MKRIATLSKQELQIVLRIKNIVRQNGFISDSNLIEDHFIALNEMAEAISIYPSILGEQKIGSTYRSISTLVDSMVAKELIDIDFQIPTKAILGKSFSVAKINFFFLLLYLYQAHGNEKNDDQFENSIKKLINNHIFSIMAEEVFMSIVTDGNLNRDLRSSAAFLLANIWEYRIDHGVKEYVPILIDIWTIRKELKPIFGTMLAVTEILKLAHKADPVLLEFLQKDELMEDEIESLREFLMGISTEDMDILNVEMARQGKSILNEKEVKLILNSNDIYPEFNYDDPRDMLKSFRIRNNNARLRQKMQLEGPKKTIEEYIISYLLEKPHYWAKYSLC